MMDADQYAALTLDSAIDGLRALYPEREKARAIDDTVREEAICWEIAWRERWIRLNHPEVCHG